MTTALDPLTALRMRPGGCGWPGCGRRPAWRVMLQRPGRTVVTAVCAGHVGEVRDADGFQWAERGR